MHLERESAADGERVDRLVLQRTENQLAGKLKQRQDVKLRSFGHFPQQMVRIPTSRNLVVGENHKTAFSSQSGRSPNVHSW